MQRCKFLLPFVKRNLFAAELTKVADEGTIQRAYAEALFFISFILRGAQRLGVEVLTSAVVVRFGGCEYKATLFGI